MSVGGCGRRSVSWAVWKTWIGSRYDVLLQSVASSKYTQFWEVQRRLWKVVRYDGDGRMYSWSLEEGRGRVCLGAAQ